jgi:hypothetical protein
VSDSGPLMPASQAWSGDPQRPVGPDPTPWPVLGVDDHVIDPSVIT